jgi:CRISPR-associated endonuclease Csn1
MFEKDHKKLSFLCDKRDINEITQDFIGRNLSDTRYISKLIFDFLREKYQNNEQQKIDIFPVRGLMTSFIRKNLGLNEKNRDEFKHHGVDAVCISLAANLNQNIMSWLEKRTQNVRISDDDGLNVDDK